MENEVMITTIDNPYDPFTRWNEWFAFDVSHGYNSCGLLARIAKTSSNLPDAINNDIVENAINEIMSFNPMYTKAYRKVSASV